VLAQKLDPKVYIAADVEQVLGFAPLAQLPDFNEVSEGVAEEYVLRLASAVEHGRKQGDLKNCIFTGTASGAGVSTLLNRVRAMLQAMGRPTVLVNATGAQPPTPRTAIGAPKGSPGLVPALRLSQSTALLREMAGETEEGEESLVLTDTAPLAVSAETEYLARFVDCAIVIIESGVTTRAQLREVAATLQRLDVGAVGFVLNRVRLAKADRGFRQAVEAVEKHVQSVSNPARRQDKSGPFAVESPVVVEMPKAADPAPARTVSPRSMFEPEVAAAAAAVARFSPAPLAKPAPVSAVCMPSGMVSSQSSEAAKRFTVPLAVEIPEASAEAAAPAVVAVEPAILTEAAEAQNGREDSVLAFAAPEGTSDKAAAEPVPLMTAEAPVGVHEAVTAPFLEAARRFASAAPSEAGNSFYPRPISVAEPVAPLRPVAEAPLAPPANSDAVPQELGEKTLPVAEASLPEVKLEPEAAALNAPEFTWESEPVQTVQSEAPLASPTEPSAAPEFFSESLSEPHPEAAPAPVTASASEDIPWWLSEVVRAPEPVRPPVLWQPARVWTSQSAGAIAEAPAQVAASAQSRPAKPLWTAFKSGPSEQHTPAADAAPRPEEEEPQALQDPESLSSRLSGLRNLLYVLGGKHTAQGETPVTETAGKTPAAKAPAAKTPAFDQRSGWAGADAAGPMHGASPRVVTAQPEFLPPKSVVIEIDKTDAHVGESSTRQDRRAAFDRVDILPSKRGQYKKI